MTVCLSLYILDHVSRTEYTRAEPMRLMYAGVAWMIGPTLGAWLAERGGTVGHLHALSSVSALVCLAYFWRLRLRDTETLTVFQGHSPNPLRHVARYAQQPRLIFAWVAALGTLHLVGDVLRVRAHLCGRVRLQPGSSPARSSRPVPASCSSCRSSGAVVRRFGIRAVLRVGFTVSGVLTASAALVAGWPMARQSQCCSHRRSP